MKIGVLKETKIPIDNRVPITPIIAKKIKEEYKDIEIKVQSSNIRAFKDEEYIKYGIPITDDLSDCDILIGIKEVSIDKLIPNKIYMFFSHTAKKQPHNRKLLQKCSELGITLIDYEYLVDKNNQRIIAFGKWAGIVGTYNALYTIGLKYKLFKLKRAYEYFNYAELLNNIRGLKLPPLKIILTGGGRVANGALELLKNIPILEITPEQFLTEKFSEPVFCRLDPWHYLKHKEFKPFDFNHFTQNPTEYFSTFLYYAQKADVYISCHYWDPNSPKLLTKNDLKKVNIKVISDITCDINGSIESTIRASSIEEPIYGYNPQKECEDDPWKEGVIAVTAIDNLPSELPRDSSEDFANIFFSKVLPNFLNNDKDEIIKNATILINGKLTPKFEYLNNYLLGLE